jgi:uncharacterized protein (DUF2344 family)
LEVAVSEPATLTITGPIETLQEIGARQVILLPLEEYEALQQRIEELEDVLDSDVALAEYRASQGKSLEHFLAERRARYDVQS